MKTHHLLLACLVLTACIDQGPHSRLPFEDDPDGSSAEEDVADTPLPDPGDRVQPDQGLPDPGPPDFEPRARIYALDPVTDERQLTEVAMAPVTHPEGRLANATVEVFNCLNEVGGLSADGELFGDRLSIMLCRETPTVTPDPDGHYLSVTPPRESDDPDDAFAELMAYHHVNKASAYFERLGFGGLGYVLPVLVNLQYRLSPVPDFMVSDTRQDGWTAHANASFYQPEDWAVFFLGAFNLPARETGALVFGQGLLADFVYDGVVIYHEFAHAVIGPDRLQANFVLDDLGLDTTPRAVNEGLADYFAASLAELPRVGVFSMGLEAPSAVRDLEIPRRCPEDLSRVPHQTGRILASTLWRIRQQLGAEVTDALVYAAMEQFISDTTLEIATELFIAEAERAGVSEVVASAFADAGLPDCIRGQPWRRWPHGEISHSTPLTTIPSPEDTHIPGLAGEVPGRMQYYFDAPPSTQAVTLAWSVINGVRPGQSGRLSLEPGSLVVRRDEPVQVRVGYDLRFLADLRVDARYANRRQEVTLGPNCFTPGGRTWTLFVNTHPHADLAITHTQEVAFHDVLDEDLPNIQRCDD